MTVSVGLVSGTPPSSSGVSTPIPIPVEELLFAEEKTPVKVRDGRQPMVDEQGRLWVERNMPEGSYACVFDVFDSRGHLSERLELPADVRVVGFDESWVYTARSDSNGFEHLQRLPLPT